MLQDKNMINIVSICNSMLKYHTFATYITWELFSLYRIVMWTVNVNKQTYENQLFIVTCVLRNYFVKSSALTQKKISLKFYWFDAMWWWWCISFCQNFSNFSEMQNYSLPSIWIQWMTILGSTSCYWRLHCKELQAGTSNQIYNICIFCLHRKFAKNCT